MKETDLKERVAELEAQLENLQGHNKRLTAELNEFISAEEVMIAAGLVSKEKVNQAHEIVRKF